MPHIRPVLFLAVIFAVPHTAAAQRPVGHAPADDPPTLVVHITVDQLRGDYLDRFSSQLEGGLARLSRGGAWFRNAYQDHAMSETAPGHATALSGREPRETGIRSNSEGVQDSTAPLLEVRGPGASPWRFQGTVLYDWMRARWPASRALSVSRKDRGAILPLGRARVPVFWYEGGQFTSSRYYMDALPGWVRAFNERAEAARAPGRVWTMLLPAAAYPEPDSVAWEADGRNVTFPHRLPDDPARAATAFYTTPWMDSLTLDIALEGVRQLGLGRGPEPDLLAVSLSATDYVGHTFGPDSRELHDQVLCLDRLLGAFLDTLFRLRDSTRVLVSLTADHGVSAYPELMRARGVPDADWVRADTLLRRYRQALEARIGPGDWLPEFDTGLLQVDRAGLSARGLDVDSLLEVMRADFLRLTGVARVDTWRALARADTATDAVARRWRNLSPPGYGELFVTLRPGFVWWFGQRFANHGQPSDSDTHVPIVLWGRGIRAGTHQERASVADLAPTLARVLGIQPTEPVQGRVLTEALGR